ncbi:RNA pseudouridine synthase [Treponema phagedenis]|uniref:Pseudouridine synthase n=1 Tax=Treponema phagedenis TaxID=162 RepID=A0A0B7GQ70_TREPH|nr:RNA pseudouridine synthase [Treponema phagedenis]NVP25540.1 RNA pseudouridine synthase [Treponema phagedenis]QEJ94356.1 RNA pseudouridine synthase [Treponema phagedenis]QKS91677.1 RNA pseudouridine synthase [Treponema phagedenis]QLC60034.1 RNA pseudouridine synthase [Treponema phagedenis]QSH98675.1 RNA pseudouridine synthase [Treponema phagedenis]
MAGFNHRLPEPQLIKESEDFAVLYKPSGMPTAPLRSDEKNTLIAWFIKREPAAAAVIGKKEIEKGLIHRLDTATSGLVLIAKNQNSFDILQKAQQNGKIRKTYTAFCSPQLNSPKVKITLPFVVKSRFRNFGPGARKVAPIFEGGKNFTRNAKLYTTTLTEILEQGQTAMITCTLSLGYRHQVRAHLAWIGFPIIGDALYNPAYEKAYAQAIINAHTYPLQLFATELSFPNPSVQAEEVRVLLPPPDKMSL